MDAEIEPSANLWARIEIQLEPKHKRRFPIYWMAAASVAVAFTALLVFNKEEKIQLYGQPDIVVGQIGEELSSKTVIAMSQSEPAQVTSSRAEVQRVSPAKQMETSGLENNSTNTSEALQPEEPIIRLAIKQADPKPIDVMPVSPMQENPVVIAAIPQTKPDADVISEVESMPERKGIRNVGDIVNYVVNKVDKRDRKLLRFNTDEDDNSSIIGINIGFLKLNKKDK